MSPADRMGHGAHRSRTEFRRPMFAVAKVGDEEAGGDLSRGPLRFYPGSNWEPLKGNLGIVPFRFELAFLDWS